MKKTLFAIVILGSFASCKKDNAAPASSCTTSKTTVTGTYKISSIKYKASPSASEADLFASQPDCQKDDTYQLNADGTILVTDAGTSCGMPAGPGAGGWSLENNNTVLRMSDVDLSIEKFDCSNLVVTETGVANADDKKTITYTKQ